MSSRSVIFKIALAGILTVLLFVVLSTATYAWYSTTHIADAGTITFRSSTGDATGALTIGKDKNSNSVTMDFDEPSAIFPMIPIDEAVIGETDYQSFIHFQKSFEGLNELGQPVAKIEGEATTPLTLEVDRQNYFFLNNKTENDVSAVITYEFEGDLSEKLHIALFAGNEPDAMVLLGIMSSSGIVHYGKIEIGSAVAETPEMKDVFVESGTMRITIPANGSVCVRLVAWLDGVVMKDENEKKNTSFVVNFLG